MSELSVFWLAEALDGFFAEVPAAVVVELSTVLRLSSTYTSGFVALFLAAAADFAGAGFAVADFAADVFELRWAPLC